MEENTGLELNHGVVEWVYPNGTKTVQPLASMLSALKRNSSEADVDHCFYRGNVYGETGSIVALNLCNGLHGFIQTGKDGYVITPVKGDFSPGIETEHELLKIQPYKDENSDDRYKRETSGMQVLIHIQKYEQ